MWGIREGGKGGGGGRGLSRDSKYVFAKATFSDLQALQALILKPELTLETTLI